MVGKNEQIHDSLLKTALKPTQLVIFRVAN